jgi:hypothetical protein
MSPSDIKPRFPVYVHLWIDFRNPEQKKLSEKHGKQMKVCMITSDAGAERGYKWEA